MICKFVDQTPNKWVLVDVYGFHRCYQAPLFEVRKCVRDKNCMTKYHKDSCENELLRFPVFIGQCETADFACCAWLTTLHFGIPILLEKHDTVQTMLTQTTFLR